MSYCRWGWDGSHVYIIGTTIKKDHFIQCVGCNMAFDWNPEYDLWLQTATKEETKSLFAGPPMTVENGKPYYFSTYQQVLNHIAEHRANDDVVPAYVDEEIRKEMTLPPDHKDRWLPNGDG